MSFTGFFNRFHYDIINWQFITKVKKHVDNAIKRGFLSLGMKLSINF